MNTWVRQLPITKQFGEYTKYLSFARGTLKQDLLAGVTVSLVAIPQSLAYAQLAGVPAFFGLYAALIPTIVGALFGSSRQLSTGPVAMTSLLTAASVAPFAAAGSEMFFSYVILLALLSGLFQVLFGALRMGVLLNFLSHPVLMGFINAAAIIIGLSQIPTLLGISANHSEHFLVDIWQVFSHIDTLHELSFVFGVVAIAMLLFFKKYTPKIPGVLVTVVVLTFISYKIGYADMGGKVVGLVPSGLPTIGFPLLDWHATTMLLPAAFIIALISFMEAMSSSKVIALKTRQPWDENKELIGQGLAKIAAAFCHSMPVSGSFSRSALNLSSNAQTALSSVVAAIFVLLTLLYFTTLLYHLPQPVLAAVIIMAVVGLINFKAISNSWKASRDDGLTSILTFFTTLTFAPNIQIGIITGIILSLVLLLYRMMQPHVAGLGMHSDGTLRDAQRHNLSPLHPKLGAIRFDGALRFMNVSYFEDALLTLERNSPSIRYILIKCDGINYLDATGVEMLSSLIIRFKSNGITLGFSGIKKQVHEVMDKTNLTATIDQKNIFSTDQKAFDKLYEQGLIDKRINTSHRKHAEHSAQPR